MVAVRRIQMMNENEIVKLEKEECLALRSLWQEVFFEDSREYTEFYFKEKAGRNTAFYLPEKAMVHLSPYQIKLRTGNSFSKVKVNYIVGVATIKEHRHKGYMDMLLKAALEDMYKEKQPFTFLMPASPKIYEPYQFVYIYDKKEWRLEIPLNKKRELQAASYEPWSTAVMTKQEIPEVLEAANRHLEGHYDVFIQRDEQYFHTLIKELKAQRGAFYLIRNKLSKALSGYFLYTQEEGRGDIQEALSLNKEAVIGKKGILRETKGKPCIMARIIHAKTMLSFLRIRQDALNTDAVVVSIQITDSLLPANNGIWKCSIGKSSADVIKDEKAECSVTVDGLTSFIFGYKGAGECFAFASDAGKEHVISKLEMLKLLSGVFINEIT